MAATVAADTGVRAGVGYPAYLAVRAVIAALPAILGAMFLLAVVWYGLGRVGACPGLHRPGCRHR